MLLLAIVLGNRIIQNLPKEDKNWKKIFFFIGDAWEHLEESDSKGLFIPTFWGRKLLLKSPCFQRGASLVTPRGWLVQ